MVTARRRDACRKSSSISVLYDRMLKVLKKRDTVGNGKEKMAKNLDFAQNDNFMDNRCCKKLVPCSVLEILTKC